MKTMISYADHSLLLHYSVLATRPGPWGDCMFMDTKMLGLLNILWYLGMRQGFEIGCYKPKCDQLLWSLYLYGVV